MAAKKGRCAICGSAGKLTVDHVPARGVTEPLSIEVRILLAYASVERLRGESDKFRPGFQSIGFPTICSECNSERLGRQYDPELKAFANSLASWVRGARTIGLVLPPVATIALRPAFVARAVVGHLLAAETGRDRTQLSGGAMVEEMRSYFLSQSSQPSFRMFLWTTRPSGSD